MKNDISICDLKSQIWGLFLSSELTAEDTDQELLPIPAASMSIEIYTEERIAEFQEDEAGIEKMLQRLGSK